MDLCEDCRRNQATLGCLLCRKNLCGDCYERHMLTISADMDEGFAGFSPAQTQTDQDIVCEVCGAIVESEKEDEHLFEVHGISI